MADIIENLQPVPTSGDNIINVINDNFRILASRIKSLNNQFTAWDMMRITTIFRTNETNPTVARNQFIAQAWAGLDNYNGVYIDFAHAELSFNLNETVTVYDGDYLIKLPGNQVLYIQGRAPVVYKPVYSANDPFNITFKLLDREGSEGGDVSVNVPNSMTNNHHARTQTNIGAYGYLRYSDGGNIIPANKIIEARWYTSDGEEVLWTNSFKTNYNSTSLSGLIATFIYTD